MQNVHICLQPTLLSEDEPAEKDIFLATIHNLSRRILSHFNTANTSQQFPILRDRNDLTSEVSRINNNINSATCYEGSPKLPPSSSSVHQEIDNILNNSIMEGEGQESEQDEEENDFDDTPYNSAKTFNQPISWLDAMSKNRPECNYETLFGKTQGDIDINGTFNHHYVEGQLRIMTVNTGGGCNLQMENSALHKILQLITEDLFDIIVITEAHLTTTLCRLNDTLVKRDNTCKPVIMSQAAGSISATNAMQEEDDLCIKAKPNGFSRPL